MRGHFLGFAPFAQLHQNGLHFVFLGAGHQPGDAASEGFRVLLDKHIALGENHLFIPGFGEKIFQIAAQAFQHVRQRGDGWRGQIPLHLRDESFAQFASIRHFFLGQVSLQPQLPQLLADIHNAYLLALVLFTFTKHAAILMGLEMLNRRLLLEV